MSKIIKKRSKQIAELICQKVIESKTRFDNRLKQAEVWLLERHNETQQKIVATWVFHDFAFLYIFLIFDI